MIEQSWRHNLLAIELAAKESFAVVEYDDLTSGDGALRQLERDVDVVRTGVI